MNIDIPVGFRAGRVGKASDHGGVQKRSRHRNDVPADPPNLRKHSPEMGARLGTPLTTMNLSKCTDDIRLENGRGDVALTALLNDWNQQMLPAHQTRRCSLVCTQKSAGLGMKAVGTDKETGDVKHRRRRAFFASVRMGGYPLMPAKASGPVNNDHLLEYISEHVFAHDDRLGLRNRL